jgi:hypothetical protein
MGRPMEASGPGGRRGIKKERAVNGRYIDGFLDHRAFTSLRGGRIKQSTLLNFRSSLVSG